MKNKLWRRYKHSQCEYDRNRYVQTKNQLRTLTRTLRSQFESLIAGDIKTAPKKFWSYVKSRTKTRSKIPTLRKIDGTCATDAKDKAETLNDFFINNFTEERLDDLPAIDENNIPDCRLDSFTIPPEVVLEKLMALKQDKTPGPDGWHPFLLKGIANCIYIPLAILFQKSLDEGVVPNQWLEACVTAIHKKGLKSAFQNYRPVSMTSIICKLMESIVRDKIVGYMMENNLISNKQHGFVPNRNCMSNLLTCLEHWCQFVEDGCPIDVIYTDFARAFDRVPHKRLLQKMKSLGITGSTLNWVKAFLTGRRQQVCVDGEYSQWGGVKSGIPQGSVLGPILFILFINDMPDVCTSVCQLFADDAKIYRKVSTQAECDALQDDIKSLHDWSTTWQLLFNLDKCKVLHIGRNNMRNEYRMNGKLLEAITEEKDLGVLIDNELKFHKQTAAAVKKANSVLGVIKRTFAKRDEKTFPLLYKTLVRPHLEYGNVVWGPLYQEDIKAVEKVQRRATKIVPGLGNMSYTDRLHHLKLPSLTHRRRRGDMIYTYKILTGKMDVRRDDFFKISNLATRGHNLKLCKQRAMKFTTRTAFSNRIINDWNALPSYVVEADTVNEFKSSLDEHWGEEAFNHPF